GGLKARDATGKVLPSGMLRDGNRLNWQIDDRDAVYPVTIDPVVVSASKATATFTGVAANDEFGYSTALSSDGSTALVGALQNGTAGTNAGAAYIFVKPAGGWSGTTSASAANATFTGGAANDNFGVFGALSSDGSTALVGAWQNGTAGTNAGAAYIFVKPAGGWSGTTSASAANATFTGGAANDNFGVFSALSSDGSTALVSSYVNGTAGTNAGAAYIFTKPGGGWSGRTSASAANAPFIGGAANDLFGQFVALSPDGSTALVGANQNSTAGTKAGAAYIFTKPGGGWSGRTSASAATATFTGGAANDNFGWIAALSSNGSTALVGAYQNSTAGTKA